MVVVGGGCVWAGLTKDAEDACGAQANARGAGGVGGDIYSVCRWATSPVCVWVGSNCFGRRKLKMPVTCDAQARLDRISDPSSSYWGEELGPREYVRRYG